MTTWQPHDRVPGWRSAPVSPEVRAFHRTLDGYAPTPLWELPSLAAELGVGRVFAKDESSRLGLPAFKALGASWAVHRALADHGNEGQVTVVTATDGNHGRAVARFSRQWGHRARIVVPTGVHPVAVQAIRDEGAEVIEVDGSYDDAVAAAARLADAPDAILVQDTAWEGYEDIPQSIVDGYATLFAEIDEQAVGLGLDEPDLVIVPVGVGSLLQAALAHYRRPEASGRTAVVSVEPAAAACVPPSLQAGRPVSVPTGVTIMAGLNCGTPSSLAWPLIAAGLDAAVVVTDDEAASAADHLRIEGIPAGPCGGAGLAGLRGALTGSGNSQRRAHLRIDVRSTVVLIVTEGREANPATG